MFSGVAYINYVRQVTCFLIDYTLDIGIQNVFQFLVGWHKMDMCIICCC